MRYFMLGKTFEEDGQGQEHYRWFYDNNETQPLYSCMVKTDSAHCLPEAFSNNFILRKYFAFDIMKSAEEAKEDGYDFGQHFSKNIFPSTHIYYYEEDGKNYLKVDGRKTYSRRTEGKPRYYPAIYIANRVRWFLSVSPFVESFKEKKSGLHSTFEIKFKPQITKKQLEA